MSTTTPKAVLDVIALLKAEQAPLTARLDAIELTIDNLNRVWGLHGTPQPLPLTIERPAKVRKVKSLAAAVEGSEAVVRRALLLGLIEKSGTGLTLAEIRKHTPELDNHTRANALNTLRVKGHIRRAGNAWVKAA